MTARVQVAPPSNSLGNFLLRLWQEDAGQDIVEYALVALAMGLTSIAGVHGLAASIANDLNLINNAFGNATGIH